MRKYGNSITYFNINLIQVNFDYELTETLWRNLESQGCNVTGFSFFGPPGSPEIPSVLKYMLLLFFFE